MWEIRRYNADCKEEWDAFVEKSRNATFLFRRDYMDYHSNRFADFSLLAYRHGKLAAILPANVTGDILHSHQGLTYGGWALLPGIDTSDIYLLWREWLAYCRANGITSVIYKPLPYIYAEMPSEEDRYLLFLCNALPVATDISTSIDLRNNPGFNTLQRRHLKSASNDFYGHLITAETPEFVARFHAMLSECLRDRHDSQPVHSAEELQLLMERFPDRIRIWSAYSDAAEGMLAGICVYETRLCVHCQYIATSAKGREMNMLAPLVAEMIDRYTTKGFRYFDFGISNEGGGLFLNPGLNRQKTAYGGSGVAYTRYAINIEEAIDRMPATLWPE